MLLTLSIMGIGASMLVMVSRYLNRDAHNYVVEYEAIHTNDRLYV